MRQAEPRGLAAFWKHHPVADQATDTLVAATLDFQCATNSAIVKLTPAGNYQIADRGGQAHWDGDPLGRRSFRNRAINTAEDWAQVAEHAATTPLEQAVVAAATEIRAALGPQPVLLATAFSPLSQALMLAGPERLAADLADKQPELLAALETLSTATQRLIADYRRAGVDGIYLAMQHLTEPNLPRTLYRDLSQQLGRSIDQDTMAACNEFHLNILHLHGAPIHLDCLPTGVSWRVHYELCAENPSPADFRAHCDCPAVIGLPFAVWDDPSQLAQAMASARQAFAQDSALYTGPCVVPLAVPEAQIAQWVQHAQAIA
jgi:hypothetical protein